jgi:outer membrane autotransporter protein
VAGGPSARPWGTWLSVVGIRGDQDSADGYRGHDYRSTGQVMGVDYRLREGLLIGATGSNIHTSTDLNRARGSNDISTYFGSVYGTWFTQRAYVEAVASFGRSNIDSERSVRVGPTIRRASADYDSDAWSAFSEVGLRMPLPRTSVLEPFASLGFAYLREEGFRESGADSVNLNVDSRDSNSLRSELGLRLRSRRITSIGRWTGEFAAAWSHDFDIDDRAIHAGYAGAGGSEFALDGRNVSRNGTRLEGSVTLHSRRGYRAALSLGAEIRQRLVRQMARLELSLDF